MNKTTETRKTDNTKADAIETIETIALDNVTGGCAACGNPNCGQAGGSQQLAANFLRR